MTAWQGLPPQTRRQARMNERETDAVAPVSRANNGDENSMRTEQTFPNETARNETVQNETARNDRAQLGGKSTEGSAAGDSSFAGFPSDGWIALDRTTEVAGDSQARPSSRTEPPTGYGRRAKRAAESEPQARESREHSNASPQVTHQAPDQASQPPQWISPASAHPAAHVASFTSAKPPTARLMSRRELRELESLQGLRPEAADGPDDGVEAPAQPETHEGAHTGPAQPGPAQPGPAAEQQAVPVVPALIAPVPIVPVPVAIVPVPVPVVPVPAPVPAPIVSTFSQPDSIPSKPRPELAASDRGVDYAPGLYTSPTGHWATESRIDNVNHGEDSSFRSAGSSSAILTTNVLVIPSILQVSDLTNPLSSTGEILVTGTIDLPPSLGSTGARPNLFDHSDLDLLFAAEDNDFAPSDSAPVRAIRAVSTHTATNNLIVAKRPVSTRLPMIMAVTAGILAVCAVALLAAGMIFGNL